MNKLLEDSRSQLLSRSKSGANYAPSNQAKGKNRYARRVHSKVAKSVKEFNSINMNKLFKDDILDVNIQVQGETNNYIVTFKMSGVMSNLQRELDEILKNYNASSKYLLCMPYRYFSNSNLVLNKRVLISCWSTPKRMFKKLVKKECIYGDAFVFAKDSRKRFEQIWRDYSNIILVHNDPQYLGEVCNFDKQRGYYIEVPKRNAYDVIEYIEMNIKDVCENNRLEKSRTIILLSAGPTAKVLTYHLSEQGYIAIDCGHVWDEPLEV